MISKRLLLVLFTIFLDSAVFADVDNYYSISETSSPYELYPGDSFQINFSISNKDLFHPKNVTAYIDPCPVDWICEEETFSWEQSGNHQVNLSVSIPDSAVVKRYTMYVKLDSEELTRRGDDRLIVTLHEPIKTPTTSIKELPPPPSQIEPLIEESKEVLTAVVEPGPQLTDIPDKKEIKESVEHLESSHQFIEYISFLLIVVLVMIVVGAFITYKKDK